MFPDTFSGTSLDSSWTPELSWPEADLTVANGECRIELPMGELYTSPNDIQTWDSTVGISQSFTSTSFDVAVQCPVGDIWSRGDCGWGVIIFGANSTSDYVIFEQRSTIGGANPISRKIVSRVDGTATVQYTEVDDNFGHRVFDFIRVALSANSWTIYGSADGVTWASLATFSAAFSPNRFKIYGATYGTLLYGETLRISGTYDIAANGSDLREALGTMSPSATTWSTTFSSLPSWLKNTSQGDGSVTVSNNELVMTRTGGNCCLQHTSITGDFDIKLQWYCTASDAAVETDQYLIVGTGRTRADKYGYTHGHLAEIRATGDTLFLRTFEKRGRIGVLNLNSNYDFKYANVHRTPSGWTSGAWNWLRVQRIGNRVRFKGWANGASEPSTWDYDGHDEIHPNEGQVYITWAANSTLPQATTMKIRNLTITGVQKATYTGVDSLSTHANLLNRYRADSLTYKHPEYVGFWPNIASQDKSVIYNPNVGTVYDKLFFDNFERPDSTDLGSVWSSKVGWGISGGKAVYPGNIPSQDPVSLVDVGSIDQEVTASCTYEAVGDMRVGVNLRGVSTTDYILVEHVFYHGGGPEPEPGFKIYVHLDGSFTLRDYVRTDVSPYNTGDKVTVRGVIVNNTVFGYFNDELIVSCQLDSAEITALASGTKAGLYAGADYDYISVAEPRSVPLTPLGPHVVDDFNRADSPLLSSTDPQWVSFLTPNDIDVKIVSNKVTLQVTGERTVGAAVRTGSNDMYAQATLTSHTAANSNTRTGPIVRFDPTTGDHYQLRRTATQVQILKRVGSFATVGSAVTVGAFSGPEVLKLRVAGSTLIGSINGVDVVTQTDTGLATGQYGGLYLRLGVETDVIEYDDFKAGPGTSPDSPSGHLTDYSTTPSIVQNAIGSQPAVNFPGQATTLLQMTETFQAEEASTAFTMVAVIRMNVTTGTQVFMDGFGSDRNAIFLTSGRWATYAGSVLDSGDASDSLPHVVTAVFGNPRSGSEIYLDGTLIATGNTGAQLWGRLVLGAQSNTQYPANVQIAEAMTFNKALDENERASIHTYVQDRYGITVSDYGISPPTGLAATAVSSTQIDLSWDAVASATSYDVERDGVIIASEHAGTTYSDTGRSPATEYTYRVRSRQ